jgi:hypothetical protein
MFISNKNITPHWLDRQVVVVVDTIQVLQSLILLGNCGGTRGFTIFSLNKTFPKWGEMVQEGNVHLVEEARVTRLCI